MSRFSYGRLQDTGLRLIERFGQPGTILRPAPANPTDPDVIDPGTSEPCEFVSVNWTVKERESSLIREGDRKLLVAAKGLSGTPAGRIQTNDGTLRIIDAKPLNPGGTPILYTLQVRS